MMEERNYSKETGQLLLKSSWIFFLTSVLHFLYSVTGFYPFSFISSVNESVWEHTKIVFFAALIFSIILYFKDYRGNNNYIAGLAPALFSIIITVPMLFYGYTGILGTHLLVIDLLIAFISASISQYILQKFVRCPRDLSGYQLISILLVVAMIIAFFVFTWYPPKLPLFREPG